MWKALWILGSVEGPRAAPLFGISTGVAKYITGIALLKVFSHSKPAATKTEARPQPKAKKAKC